MEEGERAGTGIRLQAWQVAGVLLVLVVSGLALYAYWPALAGTAEESAEREQVAEPEEAPTGVEAVVLQPADFPLRVEATGHLMPWRRARISAEASGRVTRKAVEEGSYVAEGDLLVQLDDRQERLALEEAQAELLNARAEYAGSSQGTPPDAGNAADLEGARQRLQEAEEAREAGEINEEALREARRQYEMALLSSGARREEVKAAAAGVPQAEHRVEQARLALSLTKVTAPFSGRVSDVQVETGQNAGAGEEVLTLLQDGRMKVAVDVLESNIVKLERGSSARVVVPAMEGAVFEGTIFSINPSVDPEAGTGRVTVAIPNPQGRLYSGLFARVQLETGRLEDRLVVPEEAVLMRQGRDLVFRLEDGRAQWTYVTVGARSSGYVEITDGLGEGDTVAVSGHFALAHDAPARAASVRPVQPE